MDSPTGGRFGSYETTGLLGAGGMGEVYRARDTRLNREVAIKILPQAFALDADRLARFKREAQVLASLNHPNIGAIYGLEEWSNVRALVLELVEGPTLADCIARTAMPVDEVLAAARQIANALEFAHDQGVVHRDLKPANIKLRPDGMVKVLDFGLAKALAPPQFAATDPAASPTITSPAVTRLGVMLGTAAYMSPEQAKGRPADKRSDVWAFGCVLFEMLSGRRAFDGEDIADTLVLVLTKEPDWTALPADTPASVRTLLRRCLEKDRRKRLADIADAKLELDDADHAPAQVAAAIRPGPVSPRRLLASGIGGLAAGVLLTAGLWAWLPRQPLDRPATVRFTIPAPEGHAFYFGTDFLSVSPDGRHLAFVTGTARSENQLWIRPLDSVVAKPLEDTTGAVSPLWSPDGRSIVFSAGASGLGRLRRMDIAGGRAITLVTAGVAGAWSRDGTILFRGSDSRIHAISENGGEARAVTSLDPTRQEGAHTPAFFLPDGRRFIFHAQDRGGSKRAVYLASLDASTPIPVLEDAASAAYAGGYLLFERNGALMRQRFDERSGQVSGGATPVLEHLDYNLNTGQTAFSISSGGVLVYRRAAGVGANALNWVALDGRPVESLPFESAFQRTRVPKLSPDARRLAMTHTLRQGETDIWLIDLERSVPSRFTFDGKSEGPVWSHDGARLFFTSLRQGAGDLFQRHAAGVGRDELLYESPHAKRASSVSSNGAVLLFSQAPEGNPEIWALPLTGERKPVPLVKTGFPAGNAVFSPDGRWFAYCEGDSGDQVYIQPYPPSGERIRVSSTTGSSPQWSHDGKSIVYATAENQVMTVDVALDGQTPHIGRARRLFTSPTTFFHRAVLFDSKRSRLLVPAASGQTAIPPIEVVMNWIR